VDYNRTVIGLYDSEEEAYTAYTAKMEELGDDLDFLMFFYINFFLLLWIKSFRLHFKTNPVNPYSSSST
jgi:hypothetical protein